jgi:uncharacterized membrane protein
MMPTANASPLQRSSLIAQSLKARADAKRTLAERVADRMTALFGSMHFLLANLLWFVVWIVINLNLIPGVAPFDPFPFGLLTMIVSLEAIALAIVVLISQNREAKIATLREEEDLQVDVITEQEITTILQLLVLLLDKQQVDYPRTPMLEAMLQQTDTDKLEKSLEEQV